MKAHTTTSGLIQRWVPVTDARGRTRLEAVWLPASERLHANHAA